MFRQGQLAVHGLAILLGRNEAGISNRGKFFLHHAVDWIVGIGSQYESRVYDMHMCIELSVTTNVDCFGTS